MNQNRIAQKTFPARPSSLPRNHAFSAYITAAPKGLWSSKGNVDHDIMCVVSGISDTSLSPNLAAEETASIFDDLFLKKWA